MSGGLIIAGGGTGGHVLAGVAVADAWRARAGGTAPEADGIVFVGARGGIEEKLVPRAGYPLQLLRLGSLNRVGLLTRLRTLFLLPFSLLKSALVLLRLRPRAVLGVGGYASGPLLLMARVLTALGLLRARTAILEQNSVPGMTNRILGKLVDEVYCAFPGMESQFPGKKVIVTGNPTRSAIRPLGSARRDPFTIFIFGGSQGALGINTLVLEALPLFEDLRDKLKFIHQTGEKDYERVAEGYRKAGIAARVEKFIHDMPSAYAEASLLICRAGSSTLSEIAAVGRAALLIPFPFASDNHQERNARILAERGAALLLVQAKATGVDLARIVRRLQQHPAELDRMEAAVRQFYRPEAARDVVSGFLA
ncbi:MAG: undecaprenyldiphospho-muramoylpentapeptide beta-N-acetylglucosaminyltransferase [Oligoflexia bacterium]|nr:undecaprenyldiphospho-muramoylpentapeptide beta-N-acetylglucosaminyltransferase [Oligoflexia bacterium]